MENGQPNGTLEELTPDLSDLQEEVEEALDQVPTIPPQQISDPQPELFYRLGATEGTVANLQASMAEVKTSLQSIQAHLQTLQNVEVGREQVEQQIAEELEEVREELANPPSFWEVMFGGRGR